MKAIKILGAVVHIVSGMMIAMAYIIGLWKLVPNSDLVLTTLVVLAAGYITTLFSYFVLTPDWYKSQFQLREERIQFSKACIRLGEVQVKYLNKIEKDDTNLQAEIKTLKNELKSEKEWKEYWEERARDLEKRMQAFISNTTDWS